MKHDHSLDTNHQPNDTDAGLWELVYGLLDDREAAELRARIETDPSVAARYQRVLDQRQLVAEAARLALPVAQRVSAGFELAGGEPGTSTDHGGVEPVAKPPRKSLDKQAAARGTRARWMPWLVSLTAAVLVVVGLAWWQRRVDEMAQANMARQFVRTIVTGPARWDPQLPGRFTVRTTQLTGDPAPTEVEYRVFDEQGELRLQRSQRTDREGSLSFTVPTTLVAERARIEVETVGEQSHDLFTTHWERADITYQTYLATDKPLYRPGEAVFYRSLTLSRFGLAAAPDLPLIFELTGPSGAAVPLERPLGVTEQGVANGTFAIQPGLPGGKYTLTVRSPASAFEPRTREFFIRDYRPPRFQKQLELTRDSYGPGDEVIADFSAQRAEGGQLAGQSVTVVAMVDGKEVHKIDDKTASSGTYQVRFRLPDAMETGSGTLVVTLDDGGTKETIAKTIPINLGKVDVAFYPEGGDLVPDLESRVYFHARDPLGKPVHIEGQILDSRGNPVAHVATGHEGRGRFTLTPRTGETYSLKITSPRDVNSTPALPLALADPSVVMRVDEGVVAAGEPIAISLWSTRPALPMVVVAACRGTSVAQADVVLKKNNLGHSDAHAVLTLPDAADGVIRVTALDYSREPPRPVAERLVFRGSARSLIVGVADVSDSYVPGGKVRLSLTARDEQSRAQPAVLGVSVVDAAILSLADEKRAEFATHFRLTGDLEKPEELEDANFFLGDGEKNKQALDLLLGTQGWRRFATEAAATIPGAALAGVATPGAAPASAGSAALSESTQADLHLPLVHDNLAEIRRRFEQATAAVPPSLLASPWIGQSLLTISVGLLILAGIMVIGRMGALWSRIAMPAVVGMMGIAFGLLWIDGQRVSRHTVVVMDRSFSVSGLRDQFSPMVENAAPVAKDDVSAFSDLFSAGSGRNWVDRFDFAARVNDEGFEFRREQVLHRVLAVAEELPVDKLAIQNDLDQGWGRLRRRALGGMNGMGGGGMGGGMAGMAGMGGRFDVDDGGGMDLELGVLEGRELGGRLSGVQLRFPVRQYAHQHPQAAAGSPRTDFVETLYWHPLLLADASGQASLEFDLSDAVTTFQVRVDAHGAGRIGTGQARVVSKIPFSVEPKLPLEVSAGDRIELPVSVNNDSLTELAATLTLATGDLLKLDGSAERARVLPAAARVRESFALDVVGETGEATVELTARAGALTDGVKKSIRVVPPGFPAGASIAGRIDEPQRVVVELPSAWVPGSLKVSLTAFPSALADLRDGIEGIVSQPHGCFEQASSSNYPNIWALRFMQENQVADPDFTRRAREMLAQGYAKLAGYECPQRGYEWFGGDPGHEALTAYGLMEFRDMAAVWNVDASMVDRTAQWLLSRRDGKGGFLRNAKALDSFGNAPLEITNAYIVWALLEADQQGLSPELDLVVRQAGESDDAYLVALAANAAGLARHPEHGRLLDRLTTLQAPDGFLEGKKGSITRSGGTALRVETTSLAALAWLRAAGQSPTGQPQREPGAATGSAGAWSVAGSKAIEWITKNRQGGGGFGSTQATVLALKALVEHAKTQAQEVHDGALVVQADGAEIGRVDFNAGQTQPIRLQGFGGSLKPGKNEVTISMTADNKMPYALEIGYRTRTPVADEACAVRLTTELSEKTVRAGETVRLNVQLANVSGQGQPMTTAIVGLPAGLEARQKQLEELRKAGKFDFYEQSGRELVFYWRSLGPDVKDAKAISWQLDLIAEIPGKYEAPASRAYLYYTAEHKQWVEPLRVEIE